MLHYIISGNSRAPSFSFGTCCVVPGGQLPSVTIEYRNVNIEVDAQTGSGSIPSLSTVIFAFLMVCLLFLQSKTPQTYIIMCQNNSSCGLAPSLHSNGWQLLYKETKRQPSPFKLCAYQEAFVWVLNRA